MNCIEFEIGGKLRGFKFGLKFLGDILEHFDTDIVGFGEMLDSNPFKTRPAILYFGHLADTQRKGHPLTFSFDDVMDWVEDLEGGVSNPNVISAIMLVLESVKIHIPKSDKPEKKGTAKKK